MKVVTSKITKGGSFKRLVNVDRNARPDKDMRVSDRLNTSIEDDHSMHGGGLKRDPKTGRMLPTYGSKNVRDNSTQYDRARYKNDPLRSLYSTATHIFNRCLLKGIKLDDKFYEMEHTYYRQKPASKYSPMVAKGEKFKDVIWGIRAHLVELWELCLAKDGGRCPCCPNEMIINAGGGQKAKHSRTVDRRIPEKGYVLGNLRFVCDHCNRIMSSGTVEDVVNVLIFMLENDYELINDFEVLRKLAKALNSITD